MGNAHGCASTWVNVVADTWEIHLGSCIQFVVDSRWQMSPITFLVEK